MTDRPRRPIVGRRSVLRAVAAGGIGSLAGCASDDGDGDDVDVIAGPDGRLVYEPETLRVEAGETVTWLFESRGHNVSCVPDHSEFVALPDDAEPFASYGEDGSPNDLVQGGETYSHTFEVPGEYVYVCIPHERADMIGTVVVE